MTQQMNKLATVLVLAGAFAASAASPTLARGGRLVAGIAKLPADANGYFYVPPNYVDDGYVYDPPGSRSHRHAAGGRSHHRHRSS